MSDWVHKLEAGDKVFVVYPSYPEAAKNQVWPVTKTTKTQVTVNNTRFMKSTCFEFGRAWWDKSGPVRITEWSQEREDRLLWEQSRKRMELLSKITLIRWNDLSEEQLQGIIDRANGEEW